ncbi:tetratricopeptide repeat protein [Flavivirga spongiicola]|uniref:Tetratricopeptide repeat protein n=1 Tax=Flavivirga spongiicola TaxID=421621 RepID=A0ABU7XQ12_9FLAO|nr:tetratricopeptide repeat protein [Flavivirga sp. MEBiC05379]MDO5977858.1 tetratricopeptide repeat protein [Flavivirga sp. MEBiC05379]
MKKKLALFTVFISLISYSQIDVWDENPNDSQLKLDSLLIVLPESMGEERLKLLNEIAQGYWFINPDKTIEYGTEALRLSQEFDNKEQEGFALINLCQGYLVSDLYDKALRYGLQSLEIRKTIGNKYDLAYTLRTIGWLYYDIGYFDKALDYHKEVLLIHEEIGDKQRIAYSYNSIGLIHAQQGDCNLALSFFRKSLELKKAFNNEDRISETMKNMGICHRKINELDAAKELLESSLEISNKIKDDQSKVETLNELAIVNLKLEKYDTCYKLLNESRLTMEKLKDNIEWIVENYRIRSDYFLALGNYKEAFNNYKKYEELKSSIFSNDKSRKLTEMRILDEAERRESEIKLLEQQKNLEREKRQGLMVVSILLAIIGILIIVSLWNNIKKKKAIFKQNEKLSEEKFKTQSLLKENLEHKLEYRMKELTNLALFISQRTSIYKDLTKSFKSLEFTDVNKLKKDIALLIKEYTFKFNFNEDIQKFHANVETLQSDFLFRIKEKHPNLTDKEVQLAVQVKLKLSSKEIASINNLSLNSVEIGRHRLRKKLNLESKESLSGFLENI